MEFELLAGIDEVDRRAVLASAVRRRYDRGMVIFHEGDLGDSFHLIAKGRVSIRVGTPGGDVATVNVLGVGSGFGEQALLTAESRRTASAVAVEPSETLQLSGTDFDDIRQRHPSVERLLLNHLSAMVQRLSTQLTEALYLPVEKRVLRRLLELDQLYGHGEIRLTQEDLATMAGTTRPTANRILQHAAQEGTVELARGRFRVVDRETVERHAR